MTHSVLLINYHYTAFKIPVIGILLPDQIKTVIDPQKVINNYCKIHAVEPAKCTFGGYLTIIDLGDL